MTWTAVDRCNEGERLDQRFKMVSASTASTSEPRNAAEMAGAAAGEQFEIRIDSTPPNCHEELRDGDRDSAIFARMRAHPRRLPEKPGPPGSKRLGSRCRSGQSPDGLSSRTAKLPL